MDKNSTWEVIAQHIATLTSKGYSRDEDGVWWSDGREHCLWVERIDGHWLVCVGDDGGTAQAYLDPKVAAIFGAITKHLT